jgi:putative CocE/NonD family hydrolase
MRIGNRLVSALAVATLLLPAVLVAQELPMEVRYDVKVRMPDGVNLSVDVFRPRDGAKHPTVFSLTPYNNDSENTMQAAYRFVQRGYAYVTADARGRYDSEGAEFVPYRADGKDGSAVMTWIAQQAWSNGKVVTNGGSYLGKVQWMMAKENNPHHAAIVSYVSPADAFNDEARYNGVPKVDLMYTWAMGMDGRVNQTRSGWNWNQIMHNLPLNTLDEKAGREVPFWRALMEHDKLDDWWAPVQMTGFYDRFDIPSFSVTGWYEGQLKGQIQNHVEVSKRSKTPEKHMLVVGPWLHGVNNPRNQKIGERDAGPEAIIDLDQVRDRWMDHVMLGSAKPDYARFLYFLPVQNEWRAADAYPIPRTEFRNFNLDSQGQANTLNGNGVLRTGPASGPPDQYVYDPNNPNPSLSSRTAGARGGLPQGSVDNRPGEMRQDVLVYTSEPLAQGMEITGPVTATIYISTDVPDTDITVKVLDVYPDGKAHNLSEGIARAKYRNSYSRPEPMEPGKVYPIKVELFPTSNYFQAGHSIRIEVSSSDFPNFARNLNTMNSDTGTEIRTANIKIHHSREFPSTITLPVVPPGASKAWKPPLRTPATSN